MKQQRRLKVLGVWIGVLSALVLFACSGDYDGSTGSVVATLSVNPTDGSWSVHPETTATGILSAENAAARGESDPFSVRITGPMQVVDSLAGVPAYYRPGDWQSDGSDGVYSCAAFVARYYRLVVGVDVSGLFTSETMLVSRGILQKVSKPIVGDIAYLGGHWALVKYGASLPSITLIEQNYKTQKADGDWYAAKDRVIDVSSGAFFRWKDAGDVNQDGKIDIVDALLVAQYTVGQNPPGFYARYADLNSDGRTDIVDAMLIAQLSAGQIHYVTIP